MRRFPAALLVVLTTMFTPFVIGIGSSALGQQDVLLYGFAPYGAGLRLTREFMMVRQVRQNATVNTDGSSSELVMGQTLSGQIVTPDWMGEVLSLGKQSFGPIERNDPYRRIAEYAYQQALQHTADVPTTGRLKIDRMTTDMNLNVDEGYAASMAVHFMGLIRRRHIPEWFILVGTLQPDGRIGSVSRFAEKVSLLIRHVRALFIPAGQLVTLDQTVIDQLQRQQIPVQEVDTLEQAYQLMIQTR